MDNEEVPLCFTASGGKAFGPRGPKSFFYMLSKTDRVNGLRSALSVKYGQDNLHIVDSLDLPTEDPDVSWQCPSQDVSKIIVVVTRLCHCLSLVFTDCGVYNLVGTCSD